MAPTHPKTKTKKPKRGAGASPRKPGTAASPSVKELLAAATAALQEGDARTALRLATEALDRAAAGSDRELAALALAGEVCMELGDGDGARAHLLRAVALDPEGARPDEFGGGADKFLYLAQLAEVQAQMQAEDEDSSDGERGGAEQQQVGAAEESVRWYEKGADILRRQLREAAAAEDQTAPLLPPNGSANGQQQPPSNTTSNAAAAATEKAILVRRKLATSLCAQAEAWMSSWALNTRPSAEARCEALATEATLLAPDYAEPWATLASVRISQVRIPEARAALARSLDLWQAALERDGPASPDVPGYAARVAVARLLLEVGLRRRARAVLETLLAEEDGVVEVWYLGGWACYLIGEAVEKGEEEEEEEEEEEGKGGEDEFENREAAWTEARRWLRQCLSLFKAQDYDDEQMGEHAKELLGTINKALGDAGSDEDDDGWEDAEEDDGDEDEDMDGA